jgi:hypothetical protein
MNRLPILVAFLCLAAAHEAAAQAGSPEPVAVRASSAPISGVSGIVVDESGTGVGGVSVLAMGTTMAMVRTDERGRFSLRLPPGPYVLRATRDGYISTYRELIDVRREITISRAITLVRIDDVDVQPVLASTSQPAAVFDPLPADDEPAATGASTSETAWRLRHLPRTALRDEATTTAWAAPAPRARSPLTLADLSGRVDVMTTSAFNDMSDWPGRHLPRSVAYVVLGAPVGRHGDWTVRTSLAGGERAAWTLVGEYATKTDRAHAFRTGVSYSAQTFTDPAIGHSLAAIDNVRRAGGVFFADHWTVTRALSIDSGLRVDRYDYLADPTLVSARVSVRHGLPGRLALVATLSPHMVAPGAAEFAAPVASGVWMPPERTFSPLDETLGLHAQRIGTYAFGFDAPLVSARNDHGPVLRVRRFVETSTNQVATMFGTNRTSQVGHYYLASPGHVAIDGWRIGVTSTLAPDVVASIDYSRTSAAWDAGVVPDAAFGHARSLVRRGTERLHDITASVDASVPATSTRVRLAVRIDSGFSRAYAVQPGLAARYALEVRQLLPVELFNGGSLNVLASVRTLHRDLDEPGGFYDELLTVAPPTRLTCGLQLRF